MKKYIRVLSLLLAVVVCFFGLTMPVRAEAVTIALVGGVLLATAVVSSLCVAFGLGDAGGLSGVVEDVVDAAMEAGWVTPQGHVSVSVDPTVGQIYVNNAFAGWVLQALSDLGAFETSGFEYGELTSPEGYTFSAADSVVLPAADVLAAAVAEYPVIADQVAEWHSYFDGATFIAFYATESTVRLYATNRPYLIARPRTLSTGFDGYTLYASSSSVFSGSDNYWRYLAVSLPSGARYDYGTGNYNTIRYGAADGYDVRVNIGEAVGGLEGVLDGGTLPDFNLPEPLDTYEDWKNKIKDGYDPADVTQDVVYPGVLPLVVTQDPYAVFGLTQDQVQTVDAVQEGTEAGEIEQVKDVISYKDADYYKVDLVSIFPFCIPFDIYNMIEALDAAPVAPHFEIPFNVPSANLSYTFDLDFSEFDSVAAVLRTMETILFCVGLALITYKVIKW